MNKIAASCKLLVLYAALFLFFTFHFSLFTCEASVYIDIKSPAIKKLPIAIQDFTGMEGVRISEIIRDDLNFTGFFLCIDKAAYLETSAKTFNPQDWSIIGAEAVIKGTVKIDQGITVEASLYDVTAGTEIFRKEYKGENITIRKMAHTIANDIYKHITGDNGIFRTRIAFVAEDEGKKGLYIMDWDGAEMKRLGIRGNFVLAPHWSKDGTKLVYSSERGERWGIYLLDFTKMTEKNIFLSTGLNMTGNFFPDGDEIMMASSRDETYGLYSFKISESKLTRITSSRGIEISPAVSPDGRQVAFVSDKGGTPQIYIMERNGYNIQRLTFEGSYNTSPSWSPDGKNIVFVGRHAGRHQVFIINSDGSGLTQLTEKGNNEDPSFSPDGRFIIFSSVREGHKGIYVMRSNGEFQKLITPSWLKAFGPRWSPN